MIIDSSAWIGFFRGGEHAAAVREVISDDSVELMTTDILRLEILSGAESEAARRQMSSLLAGCEDIAQVSGADVDDAVDLYRRCRTQGETVRAPNDCVIAAIAVRQHVPVLHADRDFEVLRRHTSLRTVSLI